MFVDIITISFGFVIRAIAGCLAISIFISPWLIICAFLLAMFLSLGKRRHEKVLLGKQAKKHRAILQDYSARLLNNLVNITTSALIISYSLYTFLTGNIYMMITIPFTIYGVFRYIYLVHYSDFGGEPEMIFRDKPLILCIIGWAVLVVMILYEIPYKVFSYFGFIPGG